MFFYFFIRHLVLKLQIQASKVFSSSEGTEAALEIAATTSIEGKIAKKALGTKIGQKIVSRVEAEQYKSVAKKQKKLKRNFVYMIVGLIIDAVIIISIVITIMSFISMISSLTTMSHMYDETVAEDNSDGEYGWEWESNSSGNGLQSAGGLYPKDPALKQVAMILESMQIASGIANQQLGTNYVNVGTILGLNLRETGGAVFNKLVRDKTLNIYNDLIYENPACGKGSNCKYITNGFSHFEGGTVVNGVDMIDPSTQIGNRSISDYNAAGGDHAIGYFQIENNSIDGYLKTVFPIGKFKDKEYTDANRYKMDDVMGFIRPNIVYIPDVIINVAYYSGDANRFGAGYKQAWAEIQRSSWYTSLPLEDQQFCWSALKDMSYQSGPNIGYESTKSMRGALELLAVMKSDGYINRFEDITLFMEDYLSSASNLLGSTFNTESLTLNRGGDQVWVDGFNKLLTDTSLKQNTRNAASRLKSTLTAGKFRMPRETNGKVLYLDIPPKSIGFTALGNKVSTIMAELINEAEKEEGSGIIGRPQGVSKDNFKETPGKSQGIWNGKTTDELVGNRDKFYRGTKQYWGTSMTLNTGKDPFGSLNSRFCVPYFSQSESLGNEKWSGYYTGSFNLQASGCGIYMWAYVSSALQQRLINPPELLTVGTHFGAYTDKGLFSWDTQAHNRLFNSFGYKVTFYTKNQAKNDGPWNDLNQALNKSIPSGFRCDNTLTSGKSHFMVITDVNDNGAYTITLTQKSYAEKRTWSRADMFNLFHKGGGGSSPLCLYVVDNK